MTFEQQEWARAKRPVKRQTQSITNAIMKMCYNNACNGEAALLPVKDKKEGRKV